MFLEHLKDMGDELTAPSLPPHSMAKVALTDANPSVTRVVKCTGHHQRLWAPLRSIRWDRAG